MTEWLGGKNLICGMVIKIEREECWRIFIFHRLRHTKGVSREMIFNFRQASLRDPIINITTTVYIYLRWAHLGSSVYLSKSLVKFTLLLFSFWNFTENHHQHTNTQQPACLSGLCLVNGLEFRSLATVLIYPSALCTGFIYLGRITVPSVSHFLD